MRKFLCFKKILSDMFTSIDDSRTPVWQRRSWMALPAALVLFVGLFLSLPASAQTTVAEATARTVVPVDASENSQQGVSSDRVPAVEEIPPLTRSISISLEEASLKEALNRVAAKGELEVSYLEELVEGRDVISLELEAVTVREALAELLRGTDLRLVKAVGSVRAKRPGATKDLAAERPESGSGLVFGEPEARDDQWDGYG